MNQCYRILCIWLLFIGGGNSAQAHQLSTAYLTGGMDDRGEFSGEWQVRLVDINQVVELDTNRDGTLLWGELRAQAAAVEAALQSRLRFVTDNALCPIQIQQPWQIDSHFNDGYLVLPITAQCATGTNLQLHYDGFFDIDSQHKLIANLAPNNTASAEQRVLSATNREIMLGQQGSSAWPTIKEFVVQGIIHIWIGIDHIAFLLSLLLTCVLVRRDKGWHGNHDVRAILLTTTWLVSAFTLAHSLTLTATALGWLHLPSRWVEASIALSVVLAALNNIFPLVLRLGWLSFGFGLIHGMGFAGVLGELGLPVNQQLLSIVAFNIGVEIGQLVIVLTVLPLLIKIRNSPLYSRYSVNIISAVISVTAMHWFIQRL